MKQVKIVRRLSWLIAALICLTSWQGLVSPETYIKETELWAAQARGQDLINLYIIPFYLLSVLLIDRKEKYFALIWTGISCYFIYTFLIYCFDIQFNRLFLLYVFILGLSCYSLFFLLYSNRNTIRVSGENSFLHQLTGGYFIFTAVLFYGAWLAAIIPANLLNNMPPDLEMLPTNPVHVLDLSIVLPGIFIGGVLLIRNKKPGYFLAPVILTFSLLMQLTIGVLMLFLTDHGQNTPVALIWFIFSLSLISLILLLSLLKTNHADYE
ncbi:hypothetical protein [Fluviicola chungangensis]|uniref:Uncharacterized protein n=1 Tax=Fluviicola chungangensis TaxID=2597671 RepID=A0A556MYV2_9FLAO|nr:hypothetical protein [Fluviicola chungangensis]TSJ44969.1 hypothetical protein FO442_10255 [Fluviicola chungangensis]